MKIRLRKPELPQMAVGLVSGLMLFLAFDPAAIAPLAWVAAVPLLWLAAQHPVKALWAGYIAGAVFFLGGLAWVGHATAAGAILLGLFLGLYVMSFAWAAGAIKQRLRMPLAIAAPLAWVTLEAIRSNFMTGFPYLLLGHSQIGNLRLMQIIDITGVYGVSFIVMCVNGLIADFFFVPKGRVPRQAMISAAVVAVLIGGAVLYGHLRIKWLNTQPGPEVAIVQANIPQEIKNEYTLDEARKALVKHQNLTSECMRHAENRLNPELPPPLVIWPETALPGIYNHPDNWVIEYRASLDRQMMGKLGVRKMLLGAIMKDGDGEQRDIRNSALLLHGQASEPERYDKMHLVPFGEYIPLRGLLPFVKTVVPIDVPFSSGSEYKLFEHEGHKFGVVICYEDVFPGLVRKFVAKGAVFIVNISNEGWFFKSAEADQHLAIARCRAIENRVGLVRGTNSGISCLIDPAGRVQKVIEHDGERKLVEGWLTGRVTLGEGGAVYTRIGDTFALVCIAATIAAGIAAVVTARRELAALPKPRNIQGRGGSSRRKR